MKNTWLIGITYKRIKVEVNKPLGTKGPPDKK